MNGTTPATRSVEQVLTFKEAGKLLGVNYDRLRLLADAGKCKFSRSLASGCLCTGTHWEARYKQDVKNLGAPTPRSKYGEQRVLPNHTRHSNAHPFSPSIPPTDAGFRRCVACGFRVLDERTP